MRAHHSPSLRVSKGICMGSVMFQHSCMRGAFRDQQQTREEFLSLIKKRHPTLG